MTSSTDFPGTAALPNPSQVSDASNRLLRSPFPTRGALDGALVLSRSQWDGSGTVSWPLLGLSTAWRMWQGWLEKSWMLLIRIFLPLLSLASDADRVDVAGAHLGLPSLRYGHSALQLAPAPFGSYTNAWPEYWQQSRVFCRPHGTMSSPVLMHTDTQLIKLA
ncbi:hypothetical protein Landi51_11158 [Colletotrichum acutatum]